MKSFLLAMLYIVISGCRADPIKENIDNHKQCINNGWHHEQLNLDNLRRNFFWKTPKNNWPKGAILILHGGSGSASQWCNANRRILKAQVTFAEKAVEQGFAVFSLDSSNIITDTHGRLCGKIWDDEVRNRPNLDLPFIKHVITRFIPNTRPRKANQSIFITGLSSGGYMTVRASSHFNQLVTAFAPVASGDPYGWHRECIPGLTKRKTVHGAGYDNETHKQITEINACSSNSYPNEMPWDGTDSKHRPPFFAVHHQYDGINDFSCHLKVIKLLRKQGYVGEVFHLQNNTKRSLRNHLWQHEYNQPILDFFTRKLNHNS